MTETVSIAVGLAHETWGNDGRIFEYTAAVDPIRSGVISRVPLEQFPPDHGPTEGFAAFDCSAALGVEFLATTPSLTAGYVRLGPDASVDLDAPATSRLLFVLAGTADVAVGDARWTVQHGDLFVVPGVEPLTVRTTTESVWMYSVDDRALLAYLGVQPTAERFAPTHYPAGVLDAALADVAAAPEAATRNRVSVLLGNRVIDDTLTVTRTLWAMYGLLPVDAVQRAHRHQSVAVDLIIDAAPGCYTLVGAEVDPHGEIIEPTRVDWESGGVFITPPGLWHSHHNESGRVARLLPIQDAGLQTYLRTLDIRFVR